MDIEVREVDYLQARQGLLTKKEAWENSLELAGN